MAVTTVFELENKQSPWTLGHAFNMKSKTIIRLSSKLGTVVPRMGR